MIYAVYSRHFEPYVEEQDSLAEAIILLTVGAEGGHCFPLGIYDSDAGRLALYPSSLVSLDMLLDQLGTCLPLVAEQAHQAQVVDWAELVHEVPG